FVHLVPQPFDLARIFAQQQIADAHAPDVRRGSFEQCGNSIGRSVALTETVNTVVRGDADHSRVHCAVAVRSVGLWGAKLEAFDSRNLHHEDSKVLSV